MPDPGDIRITDYDYLLPQERIAQHPLPVRDASRLLVYRKGTINDDHFHRIQLHLPADSLLVFNDTRVIHARLLFRKPTGGLVEIFCLEPLSPVREIQASFAVRGSCTWKCLVGNLRRWKSGTLELIAPGASPCTLYAERTGDPGDGSHAIAFHWNPPDLTFSQVLEQAGKIPLPPYIVRDPDQDDNDRYQTVYATSEGSVAAPTAGLHFTDSILGHMKDKGIETLRVTLHVGAGTFRPVTSERIGEHTMHREQVVVTQSVIDHLVRQPERPVMAVGTTTARTLESLYWVGVGILANGPGWSPGIDQWTPYTKGQAGDIPAADALQAISDMLRKRKETQLSFDTSLMIVPGYTFRIISGLITNFHMPRSTLLLLVAALVGPGWKKAYRHALDHDYRFLSYGDSCLFLPQQG